MAEQFTFFWHGPFSQWEFCPFEVEGIKYNCAEQYMMAKKADIYNDMITLIAIMKSSDPKEQKALGRKVQGFNKEHWDTIARDFVYVGNYAKFSQNPELLTKLVETQGTTLVEASPYDTIWGIGLSEKDKLALSRDTWKGTNWLGETLTKVRDDIIAENPELVQKIQSSNSEITGVTGIKTTTFTEKLKGLLGKLGF